ncbi:MAG: YdcF family protein [Planctomycetales bacterium]|nr:YdcF family protein [Planctomycetales bacterium]
MDHTESSAKAKERSVLAQLAIGVGVPIALAIVLMVLSAVLHGRPMAEKMARGLMLPCGVVWLAMLAVAVGCFTQRQRVLGVAALCAFVVHGLFGGDLFGAWMCSQLESQFPMVDPKTCQRFDMLIVLGGGTKSSGPDHAALSFAGDRVAMAVRLYHAGKAGKLLFTGENMPWDTERLSIAESSQRVANELNVPTDAIENVPGENTYQEFQHLKETVDSTQRIGLVTSATHMPRAMRLADSVGLNLVAVPADFERDEPTPFPLCLIPSASGYRRTERSSIEFLAAIVGR